MKRVALSLLLIGCGALLWQGCSRKHSASSFLPSSPEFSGALVLSAPAISLPADGFSRLEITAQITGGADLDKRKVRFSTDNGDFPRAQSGSDKKTETDVDVNSNGVASVELRSSTSATIATITAQVLESTTTTSGGSTSTTLTPIAGLITRMSIEFTPADAGTILKLTASNLFGAADGKSVIFIHADVSPELPLSSSNKVKFVTTLGQFISGSTPNTKTTEVTPDIGRRATAALESPATVGEALVTATVMDTTRELLILFGPARPEVIVVNLDKIKLERGGTETAGIAVILSRSEGKVSAGLEIEYSARDKKYGQALDLLFSAQTLSKADETATANVSLGTVEFTGTATIRAAVGSVFGEADIEIVGMEPVPDIAVSPPSPNFGSLAVNHTLELGINVSNVGQKDLVVSGLSISGAEFTIFSSPPIPAVIPPGGNVVVWVRFSPVAPAGLKTGTLTIDSNDPDEGSLAVTLTGEAIN